MEIHGVKLFFRREKAHPEPAPQENTPCGKAPAKAQDASHRIAQSQPVRKSKPPNSRQRRSSRRLAEFMRTQGTHESVAAATSEATNSPKARLRECPAHTRSCAQVSKTTPSETRGGPAAPRRNVTGNSPALLYANWKQEVLAGSPVENSDMEVAKTSPKRARESSCERRAPESGSSRSSCSTDGHTMTTPDSEVSLSAVSDNAQPLRRLEPLPSNGGKGFGGGKGKGGKGRGRGRC